MTDLETELALIGALTKCESALTRASNFLMDHNALEARRALAAARATSDIIKIYQHRRKQ